MVKAVFYTLGDTFAISHRQDFPTEQEAFDAIRQYAETAGFTRVREVSDEDYETRVTATTPNGRAGRTVGRIEFGWDA